MKMNFWNWLTMILLVVGGINWGLMGFFQYNLIGAIFGEVSAFTRFIYALVGLAALYEVIVLLAYGSEERMPGEMARRSM